MAKTPHQQYSSCICGSFKLKLNACTRFPQKVLKYKKMRYIGKVRVRILEKRTRAFACAIGILEKRTCACDMRAAENQVCERACVRGKNSSQLTVCSNLWQRGQILKRNRLYLNYTKTV
jgi:hypothetical protein